MIGARCTKFIPATELGLSELTAKTHQYETIPVWLPESFLELTIGYYYPNSTPWQWVPLQW